MPTYEFICVDCGHRFSIQHHMTEPMPLVTCPKCGSLEVQRLWSATPFHLKGHGFYKTDYPQRSEWGDDAD